MEDSHRAVLGSDTSQISKDEAALSPLSYFGVFDGHGGARCAEFAAERLFSLLVAERAGIEGDTDEALKSLAAAFAKLEEQWLVAASENEWMDGTTAAVAIVDRKRSRCLVGNVGDSEIVLGVRTPSGETTFSVVTQVHALKRSPAEVSRVQEAGGRIWKHRLGHPLISPAVISLSVSRAIGDLFFKDVKYANGQVTGLSAEPYVTCEALAGSETDQFLLIGCDGLWDTVSYSEAATFVFSRLRAGDAPQAISEALVACAIEAGSCDNITVMVVVL